MVTIVGMILPSEPLSTAIKRDNVVEPDPDPKSQMYHGYMVIC